jgi:hypothetical protein
MRLITVIILVLLGISARAQVTNIVILDKQEQIRLKGIIASNSEARLLYDSVAVAAGASLTHIPRPLEIIYYEGLLDTDPRRINTVKSFPDIDHVVTLIYAAYGSGDRVYGEKAKQIILAWVKTYKPDGNTINENKFLSFFWGYYIFKLHFSKQEQVEAEKWIMEIALKQKNRPTTPNNNWESKRLKITGIAGAILNDKQLMDHSIEGFKKYITTAYYPDGTSNDLISRDALQYHISGLKPCLSAFINLSEFDKRFDLYAWESPTGSSVKKSVEFTVPYATGEKQRREWTHSKVELDRRRAEAGIEAYQPGKLFNPQKAHELFEWACYYNPEWFDVFAKAGTNPYSSTWIGMLNSPMVRDEKISAP